MHRRFARLASLTAAGALVLLIAGPVAAATLPAPTPPATDTVGAAETVPASSTSMLLLAAIGAFSFLGVLRLVTVRSRR